MGRLAIEDMLNHADIESALDWHLRGNHFPPIHSDFFPAAKLAIEHCNDRRGQTPIELPNGLTRTAWQIVEGLHLESFLALDHDDEGWY